MPRVGRVDVLHPEGANFGAFGQVLPAHDAAVGDIREQEMIAAPDGSFGEGKTAGNPLGARLRRYDLRKVGIEDDSAPGHSLSPYNSGLEVQRHSD